MELKPKDIRIGTFRPNGGSAWVVTPDSGVFVVHLPSGFVEEESSSRSQYANKALAMKRLEERVEAWEERPAEIEVLRAKLELAMKALEIADGIMGICGGDAWERECTETMRDEYNTVMAELLPPPPPPVYPSQLYQLKKPSPKIPCPVCGKKVRGEEGLKAHNKDMHLTGLRISSLKEMVTAAKENKNV